MNDKINACCTGHQPSRRSFLTAAASGLAFAAIGPAFAADGPLVTIEKFAASGKSLGTERLPKVVKTDAEWRKQLSDIQYRVTRHADTEYAFSGIYWDN